MDVNNSKIRLEKRRAAWEEALDALTRLNRYDESTLRDYKWVAGAVELSLRNDNLSFNHHRTVKR
jgi:hypothetical protein